jgi:RNA polymerase sigma factor (sigma-70 family)
MVMAHEPFGILLRQVRNLVTPPAERRAPDREVLQRFAVRGEEAAFAELLRRHGAMVLRVCRRLLRHPQDAEDVFQATFLTLARKARSIHHQESVGAWLHGVAARLALQVRTAAAWRGHEGRAPEREGADPLAEITLREALVVLDEELARLPEHYRAPLVACYLEGQTRAEAARQLGWPLGTLKRRLGQARDCLSRRLARRGVTLSAALLTLLSAQGAMPAAVPPALASATLRAAVLVAQGKATAGAVSAPVAALLGQATRAALAGKLKAVAALLLLSSLAAGVGVLAQPTRTPPRGPAGPEGSVPAAGKKVRTDRQGDPLPPGALARLGTTRLRHGGAVRSVAFSPDRRTLASVGEDGVIRLWEVPTGKELRHFDGGFPLAFSPDGKTLAAATQAKFLALWDSATGQKLRQFQGPAQHFACLAFSPDGRTLAAGTGSRRVVLWEAATGRELRRLTGDVDTVQALAFAPDGRTLASAGGPKDGTARLWDPATGRELRRFQGHQGAVTSLAFAPGGQALATGGADRTLRLWDVASGKELRRFVGHQVEVTAVAFSPDGQTLASAAADPMYYQYDTVRLWQAATGKELARLGPKTLARTVAFSPDGKTLAAGGQDNTVRFWDVNTGKELRRPAGHQGAVASVAFSPDGKRLATGGGDNTFRLWDPATGRELRLFARQEHWVDHVAFAPDGRTLVTVVERADDPIRLRDGSTGRELRRFGGKLTHVRSVALSPDGKTLAAGGEGHMLHLWDMATGKAVRSFALEGGEDGVTLVTAPTFAPDGRAVAAVAWKNVFLGVGEPKVRLWDMATGEEVGPLAGQPEWLTTPVFSPDGKTLAALAGDVKRTPRLWEVATGKERPLPLKDPGDVCALAFTPDGKFLATADGAQTICVWDVPTGAEVRRFRGHRGRVCALAFSPDGKALASGSGDTTALIWDVSDLPRRGGRAVHLSDRRLQALWDDLGGSDVMRAGRAVWALAAGAGRTTDFLGDHLRPVAAADPRRVAGLVAELDSERFAVRQQAARELEALGESAAPALHKALAGPLPLETRRRIEQVLARQPGARLQALRAVEVLEHIGTPAARELLQALAQGIPEARQTREAKASLRRLAGPFSPP